MKIEDIKNLNLNNWNLSQEEIEENMERLSMLVRAQMMKQGDEEEKSLDSYAIDVFFCRDFLLLNDDLLRDFPEIISAFMEHEGGNIFKYSKTNRLPFFGMETEELSYAFYQKVLYLMLLGARDGSEYCRELLTGLYKTYFKKEYNGLKRFKVMDERDIIGFIHDDNLEEDEMLAMVSRVMTIAPFLGIEICLKGPAIHASYEKFLSNLGKRVGRNIDSVSIESLDIDEKLADIQNMMIENEKHKKHWTESETLAYDEALEFVETALIESGFDPDVFHSQNSDHYGTDLDMAITKALLDEYLPDIEVTYEKLQIYAVLYYTISSFVCMHDNANRAFNHLLGYTRNVAFSKFKPPVIKAKTTVKKDHSVQKPAAAVTEKKDFPAHASETEIERLRMELQDTVSRLHKVESDYGSLVKEKQDLSKKLKESQMKLEQASLEHTELVALRNHMYRLSAEEDAQSTTAISLEQMKEQLKEKKILIIGGHPNWINKLRREFPDWTFSGASILQSEDSSRVRSADYVYFFTDTISHGAYWKFLNVLRKEKIPFGYLHNVNMENNIHQIYEELYGNQ